MGTNLAECEALPMRAYIYYGAEDGRGERSRAIHSDLALASLDSDPFHAYCPTRVMLKYEVAEMLKQGEHDVLA